jgi:hypothetical protein
MALFLLCPNLGWIQGQFNFTELSLRYQSWTGCCVILKLFRAFRFARVLVTGAGTGEPEASMTVKKNEGNPGHELVGS